MTEYQCDFCSKTYKHRQSLSVHKKKCKFNNSQLIPENDKSKYKPNDKSSISQNGLSFSQKNVDTSVNSNTNTGEIKKLYKCEYCDKVYKHYQSRYKHQKKCPMKTDDKDTFTKEDMDQKINEMRAEMLEMFNKQFKMHHKTFDKLKRNLASNNNSNNSNNININNTTNNTNNNNLTINNNINIIPLGKEDFINTLNKEQQKRVVNSIYNSIKHLCNITHFNPDTPQYHSFVITNNQNNIAYTFDDKQNKFKVVTKEELIFDLIHERGSDIRDFIDINEEELRKGVCKRVKDFIDRLDTDRQYFKKKGNEIKALIYSNTRNKEINNIKTLNV